MSNKSYIDYKTCNYYNFIYRIDHRIVLKGEGDINMEFQYTYFDDEVREGFYVSGLMKRIWAAQLEVLETIDNICKKYDIKWFIDWGSLLGAVRHGGYIPWDDDFDISMLRKDYDRFNEIVRGELPEKYVWMNHNNDDEPFYQQFSRITNGHEIEFGEKYLKKYHQCPYVVGIDIFPLDYLADDEKEEEARKNLAKLTMSLGELITPEGDNVKEYRTNLAEIESLCGVKIDYKGNVKQQLFKITETLFTMHSNGNGKYVALMHCWVDENKYKFPSEYFDEMVMIPFEGIMLPAPKAYKELLNLEYGDYMKINKEGGDHGYPAFAEQEEFLISMLSEYHFRYTFSKEHLENPVRDSYIAPIKQVEKFVLLMRKAHGLIIKAMGDNQYESGLKLLVSCQNSAIRVGTMLEEHYGEGFVTVKVLEEYCEILYQIFELIQGADSGVESRFDVEGIDELLQNILDEIIVSAKNNIPCRKEILFIGCRANAWKAFDNIWKLAKEDSNYDVYVMPVPYYEVDALGRSMEAHYEGELYPEYLDIVGYDEYDIEKRHPDIIFIQNPYDECNYTTTIMPEFYSERIKGFTDKLIYIPWLELDEFSEKEGKARQTMNYFCKVPGVVHSDVVMVQSENMRKEYIRCLTEFAGEDTRKLWESKVIVNKY